MYYMKIALVGYGKMGHMLKTAAELRGHSIVCTVDLFAQDASCITGDPLKMVECITQSSVEGIIEFSHPASVIKNIKALIPIGLPLVVGTTGWHDDLQEIQKLVAQHKAAFLTASNFSVGVNLFYKMVSYAAHAMAQMEEYDVALFEAHHNQKADSPSGTALDIAKRLMENFPRKTKLVTDSFNRKPERDELHLASLRLGSLPGTHSVIFDSPSDTIELRHTARSREGFALGAIRALEWLNLPDTQGNRKAGFFSMNDVFADI